MDILLVFDLLFFGLAVYLYLFAIGKVNSADPEKQKRAAAFREKNAGWLRIAALALAALCLVNIIVKLFY